MAETTTATWWPALTSRMTWRAALGVSSASAPERPPNFIPRRLIAATPTPKPDQGAPCSPAEFPSADPSGGGVIVEGSGICNIGGLNAGAPMAARSLDPAEVEKFSKLAAEWWDPNGKFAVLHRFNPVRLAFI